MDAMNAASVCRRLLGDVEDELFMAAKENPDVCDMLRTQTIATMANGQAILAVAQSLDALREDLAYVRR